MLLRTAYLSSFFSIVNYALAHKLIASEIEPAATSNNLLCKAQVGYQCPTLPISSANLALKYPSIKSMKE
ncbi:hypothetical protein SLEP1_g51901 [Rubroshorea leprosula]|uniref:Uncharacterized protein n=1 Tax=Rubroshorea leprosula TaxID=152421 RepID=A0AAV5M8D1_9ROSI|nr:hypothetical protein SLEP1_g51901 [Rubroshorea leprosula]